VRLRSRQRLRGPETMKPEDWNPLYNRICREFGFDPLEDQKSAALLSRLLSGRSSKSLERIRKDFPDSVLVCGGSDRLSQEISSIDIRWFVIAADSATTVLLESGVRPDMIVTDLDGVIEDQIEVNGQGVPVFLHAHGDNQRAIEKYVSLFGGPVVGTCQCEPPEHIFNFGGFTDGDRAACISAELGAKTIHLVGFDFENPSEKRGKKREVKKRKLVWAKKILDKLASEGVSVVMASE